MAAGAEASAEADAEAAFLAFLAFLAFFAGAAASAEADAEAAEAIGADAAADADAGAAAKAEAANRDATRAAMILDMSVPLAVEENKDSSESALLNVGRKLSVDMIFQKKCRLFEKLLLRRNKTMPFSASFR
ncbi:MAG TPA: hypothetical protein VJ752_04835 [Burkholderiaceae bacterium]|nr:hypothetical protein [Burkholderiaceae bacterium]